MVIGRGDTEIEYNLCGSVQAASSLKRACSGTGNTDIYVVTRNHDQDGGMPGDDKAFYIIVN